MPTLSTLLTDIAKTPLNLEITSLANDSRDVQNGSLFLAYPGFRTDGRRYIQNAIAQGAAAICYDPENFNLSINTTVPCIPVKKLKQYEAQMAARFYDFPSTKVPVIGVTGTNGKTSVTHFIAQALQEPCALIGTTGYGFLPTLTQSMNTTPDGVRLQKIISECVKQGAKTLAMEVSSHALVEKRIADIQFHTAVFTNLSQDHLDFHHTMENYREAKAILFQQPGLRYAIINADDAVAADMRKSVSNGVVIYTYSLQNNMNADIVVTHSTLSQKGMRFSVKTPWGSGVFENALLGEFNIHNCLAVIGVLGALGMPLDTMIKRMSPLKAPPGRMAVYQRASLPTIVIDYAHSPDSLAKVLKTLRQHCVGKLWCVFGCGGERDRAKRAKMGAIATQLSDRVVVTNDNPRKESPECIANDILSGMQNQLQSTVILDRAAAIDYAIEKANPNDIVLIAGKGHETTQTIGEQVMPFSDSQVVSRIIQSIN